MRKAIFVVLSFILLMPSISTAQEDTVECEPDLGAVQGTLDEAQTALEEGDTETALSLMNDAQQQLALAEAECLGLVFTDEREIVIGPLFIEEGIYRAKVVTEGYFILHAMPLDGECVEGTSVFNVSGGRATEGAETIFEVLDGGCEVLLEISNVQSEYVLTFEKIR